MREIVQVRLSGFGGQGIVLAGLLLGEAAVIDGKYVAGSNSYGAQARGSGCKSEVVLSDGPIDFPHLISADILMVMSQAAYVEYGHDVNPDGLIVYDRSQVAPDRGMNVRHAGIGATEYAIKALKNQQAANMVLLGALVELSHVVSDDALIKAIEKHVGERFRSRNLKAFRAGEELVKQRQAVTMVGEAPRSKHAEGATGHPKGRPVIATHKPVIARDACESCKICVGGCPAEVIGEYRREGDSLRGALYSSQKARPREGEKRGVPPCRQACPIDLETGAYVRLIAHGKFLDALDVIRKELPFPGVMGRICHHPCEKACLRQGVDEPVSLCALKGFAADYEVGRREVPVPSSGAEKGGKVAVVGGGPSGMACALDLRRAGHAVTLFEGHERLGGMLYYGIPGYRLPKEVLEREASLVEKAGIEVRTNTTVGRDISLSHLYETFDAVFIACGAQASIPLPLAHADGSGVMGSIEFLRRANENDPAPVDRKVLVIGGGNVAVDCAITARRLGAKDVRIVCLEKRGEMAAADWEIAQAREEGVKLLTGWGPQRIVVHNGKVTAIVLKRCLSVFDRSGQFNPAYNERVTRQVEAGTILLAIGQTGRLDFINGVEGIELTPSGWVKTDPHTLETTVPGIFAGGDAVTGPGMAIDAIADGKKAAVSIDRYLSHARSQRRKEVRRNRRGG